MSTRFYIKIGHVELEYEGDDALSISKIPDLVREVAEVAGAASGTAGAASSGVPSNDSSNGSGGGNGVAGELRLSENNVASQLSVTKGPDLVMAAAAHLCFVQGKETFTRDQLRDAMQAATNYYSRSNHTKNLSSYIKSLLGDKRLIERSKNVFALPASEASSLRSRLVAE